ncbi:MULTISPECIES: bifunctional nicotinamidase/pyrazinamidase [unclassified Imperialibacter]|uniref:bifunctional nicotinamidase/pyrazinamidase n=1 Tax=unclassified Imperialibacter TaxID=2629706 RepID=UPI0012551D31|nr:MULTISPECIES: bifunctional nicotinamidase/pyrazinamidase [unclassified Imperialibacter]CAD5268163.1 Nicotinamidase [Imperialibacter sp. 75]CAD5280749.1 Nicotinamidase [Imperialibacter sp. 89]VVT01601.1 Nicotinamidase [Imperialibacter sp. EC-SDR9]
MNKEALIVVDIQNDFLPGGALAVNQGDEIIPFVNELMEQFDLVVVTQDWHPANHGSFAANHEGKKPGEIIDLHGLPQIMWPVHCVQGSKGAEFASNLNTTRFRKVFRKGTDSTIDSYSGLFDNGKRKSTGLGEYLKSEGVEKVTVVGLAADYCVKFTALDAKEFGFEVVLTVAGTRAVNLQRGDFEEALKEMERAGVEVRR